MMKYLTVVLILLFATFTASAQMADEAEMELKQQEMQQHALQISNWFQEQGYIRSNLMLAVTVLGLQKHPPVDKVLEILNASINSKQLQKSDWLMLARFCQNARNKSTNELEGWCEKNRIATQYIKKDADNAIVYSFQIDLSADDPYNRDNQRLLEKAAAAKYATEYFGYGLQSYITHLREYYSSHKVEPIIFPGLTDNTEDMFAYPFISSVVAVHVAYPLNIAAHCSKTQRQLWSSFDDKTTLECIRLMKLFRSDNNTVMDNLLANAIIASLSPTGSEQQLEANRLKITARLAYECLSTWGDSVSADAIDVRQHEIFLRMTQLFESMGETQAMAVASDQYFADRQSIDEPKPSSCLLLKDLSLEDAEKLSAVKK